MSSLLLKLADGEGQSIRGKEHEGAQWFSVYDFMTKACAYKDTGAAARNEFKRLTSNGSEYKNELDTLYVHLKFPGAGQRDTPCMTMQGLLVLLKSLGNKVSRAFREETFSILQRYLDGDHTISTEVLENKCMGKRKSYSNFVARVAKRAKTYTDAMQHEPPAVSYIYATKSDAFPGLIKIGRACNLAARLSSLNTSCAPAPHVIVAAAPTLDCQRDEAIAHMFCASTRKEGEFFKVTQEEVRTFFQNHIMSQYQLELAQYIATVQGS